MDPITAYQEAGTALRTIVGQAERMSRVVGEGSIALKQWRATMVTNASGGFPADVAMRRSGLSINASEWPSGEQIADLLQRYHKAREALRNAYGNIPEAQRGVIQSPDAFERPFVGA